MTNKIVLKWKEEWKTIKDYEQYEISSRGRVRKGEYSKSLQWNRGNYYRVSLSKSTGNKKIYVHILVAQHFIPNPDNYPIVDHINGNSLNNHYLNLRWSNKSLNAFNYRIPSDNTSGTRGVWWNKAKNRWIAELSIYKKKHIRNCITKEDAIEARKELEKKYIVY